MALSESNSAETAKRKRVTGSELARKRRKSGKPTNTEENDEQSRILLLEEEILESKKHYNNIATLLGLARTGQDDPDTAVTACVSLCRVYIRLLGSGKLAREEEMWEKDAVVVGWLRDRLLDFHAVLLNLLSIEDLALSSLTIIMKTLKAQGNKLEDQERFTLATHLTTLVKVLAQPGAHTLARERFLNDFATKYADIRFYTFQAVRYGTSAFFSCTLP
jgi:U3 small nucleolar RNA-associated protein 19